MNDHAPLFFCLNGSLPLGQLVSDQLDWPITPHEEREFEHGEQKVRPLAEVGGRDVYILHQLQGDPATPDHFFQSANDKIIHLLFFIGALKHAGAGKVTAVTPYLPYGRKDRRTKARDPVSMRYVAILLEAMGTDALVTLDIHNLAAFENAFRTCRAENLTTANIMTEAVIGHIDDRPLTIVSPDAGGAKRAELFRAALEQRTGKPVGNALMEKHRSEGIVSGSLFAGNVKDCTAIIIDDMISSGGTIMRAVKACRKNGAAQVFAVATHGLFSGESNLLIENDGPDLTFVSDSVSAPSTLHSERLRVVSVAKLIADAIICMDEGRPLYDLVAYS